MEKLVRVTITQIDNPHGALVQVETMTDGLHWELSCAARVTQGVHHPWGDEVPNEYIHMDIVHRIKHLVSKGFKLID